MIDLPLFLALCALIFVATTVHASSVNSSDLIPTNHTMNITNSTTNHSSHLPHPPPPPHITARNPSCPDSLSLYGRPLGVVMHGRDDGTFDRVNAQIIEITNP